MATVTDFRSDPDALAAFERAWDFNPLQAGKPFGLRYTDHRGAVRCSRAFASKQAAERANAGNCR
jgi:hypothetical protein